MWGVMDGTNQDPRVAEIIGIVAKEANVDPALLVREARIDELGIASIDLVQAIFEIEGRFDVEIPTLVPEQGPEFVTVGQLVDHVLQVLDKRPATGSA